MGHLPICNWLRVVTAFIKHKATAVTAGCDNKVNNPPLKNMIAEIIASVHYKNPTCSKLCVDVDTLEM